MERSEHTQPAGVPAIGDSRRELPAAARKSELPLSRFPPGESRGGRVPPARGVSKRSAETPLAHPPDGYHRGRVVMVGLDLRHREKKFKDGRHVGLDSYDLLIEVAE